MGKPPINHEIGRMIKYDPVRDVERMIISLEYLKVKSPSGMVKRISKMTRVHTEMIEKIDEKIVLTRAPRINPKTKLILNSYMHQ